MDKTGLVTIHQPEHMPWLGFFNKMAKAELFVLLDSVPFRKNYFQNRNKIMGTNQVQWLGVPVVTKGHITSQIKDTEIAAQLNPKWKSKYLKTIEQSYHKYPFFESVFDEINRIFEKNYTNICDLNIEIIQRFADRIGINTKFLRSSALDISGAKSELVLDICKATNAGTYLSGPSGRDYLNLKSFEEAGIRVKFNDYNHPVYEQMRTEKFEPFLSSLDLFMNVGFENALDIIMEGNEGVSDS